MDRILVVDDDVSLSHFLGKALSQKGHHVLTCHSGQEALKIVGDRKIDLVLLDNKLPDSNGIDILKEIKQNHPKLSIIIMTAYSTTETAIEAMRLGAFDYILKPFELDEISEIVNRGLEAHRLMERAVAIAALSEFIENSDQIIGRSKVMQEIYKRIGQVSESDLSVLILGESGTGKELVARAIYQHSQRKNKPFLAINCAAIPEPLLESELFGYEKGAFTGANRRRIGKFEQCNQGTILLDEIGDMALSTQAKILRVLQEGEFERVGGNETIRVDVRVLASTNRKLEELIKRGDFREDLYYRLNIISIALPPLRERREDLRELTEHFFKLYNRQIASRISHIDPALFDKLLSYHWPGNVRELANTINRAMILCKGTVLSDEDIIFDAEGAPFSVSSEAELESVLTKMLDPFLNDIIKLQENGVHLNLLDIIEKLLIQKALAETRGNQVQAAKMLGISRNTLRGRIEKFHIMP
jgi:two-component system, NtrC family, response regulator AtoC